MKKTFLLLSATICFFAKSQVGINTTTPQATLDIIGNPANSVIPDGLLIPRLTGDELRAKDRVYTKSQTGMLVYVTEAVKTASEKTANLTTTGYHYFDGKIWKKFDGAAATGNTTNKIQALAAGASGYENVVSGVDVPFPGNSTVANLDMSIGTGDLVSWRTDNTTLTVPTGKGGRYLISYTAGVKVSGTVSASYIFAARLKINSIVTAPATTTVPIINNGSITGNIFPTSWSEIITLAPGDTIKFDAYTYSTTGTPQTFRLTKVTIESLD